MRANIFSPPQPPPPLSVPLTMNRFSTVPVALASGAGIINVNNDKIWMLRCRLWPVCGDASWRCCGDGNNCDVGRNLIVITAPTEKWTILTRFICLPSTHVEELGMWQRYTEPCKLCVKDLNYKLKRYPELFLVKWQLGTEWLLIAARWYSQPSL